MIVDLDTNLRERYNAEKLMLGAYNVKLNNPRELYRPTFYYLGRYRQTYLHFADIHLTDIHLADLQPRWSEHREGYQYLLHNYSW